MRPRAALQTCRDILGRSGSSFALAFRVLPPAQRDAMTAFYAFCRQVDDAIDEAPEPAAGRRALCGWQRRLAELAAGRPAAAPVDQALAWAVARFGIQTEHLSLILEGVERDLQPVRLQHFEALYEYCYRVASAVGLVCVTICHRRSPAIELYAELTGIAVQLTNILRDVDGDAAAGRIYLPLEDLRAFGLQPADLLAGRDGPARRRLLRFQARRAEHYYRLAAAALPPADRHALFFAETLRLTYQRLLHQLQGADFAAGARVALGTPTKLAIALRRRLHPATFAIWRIA
jgi:phytoene synthase